MKPILRPMLPGRHSSLTRAALRADRVLRLEEVLHSLDAIDREVLALRYYERPDRAKVAMMPGITREAGTKRHVGVLNRSKDILATLSGAREGP
jgi:RNA polymerase sigma-70 factor, ECF subfamily